MKSNMMQALLAAMICTFCLAGQVSAGVAEKPIVVSDEHAAQARAGGLQRLSLHEAPGSGVAAGGPAAGRAGLGGDGRDMFKVLSVIGHRTGDQRLLEMVKYKLSAMSDNRLRIAVSLSERAADDDGPGVKTDVAFLLLATLIIFS